PRRRRDPHDKAGCMTVDRATRTLIDQLVEFGDKPLSECTLEEARERFARVAELTGPGPDMRRVEEHRAPGPDGNVQVRVLVPQQPPTWRHRVLPRRRVGARLGRCGGQPLPQACRTDGVRGGTAPVPART